MQFFGFNMGSSMPKTKDVVPEVGKYSVLQGHYTPSYDISKPVINDYYITSGYVRFAEDNLYPDVLAGLYFSSPLHRAITNFKRNAMTGGGFESEYLGDSGKDKLKQASFDRIVRKNSKALALDLVLHSRMYMKLTFDKEGNIKTAHRIDPTFVRHERANIYGEVDTVFISRDWDRGGQILELPVLDRSVTQTEAIYMYQEPSVGCTTYSLPAYATAANWMQLDGEISYLQKSNILNSINPSIILNFPNQPKGKEGMRAVTDALASQAKGPRNAGKAFVLFSKSRDQMPEITTPNTSQNDKLFMQTSKDLRDNICFAHEINPSIVGIKVAGQLGNSEELKASWEIFNKNVLNPLTETLEEYFDILMDVAKVTGKICFVRPELNFGDAPAETEPTV